MKQLILGSSSPRRKDLLKSLGFSFEIIEPNIDETFDGNILPQDVPSYIAEKKFNSLRDQLQKNHVLLCADTVVILNNEILGKPSHNVEALEMLMKLSDNWHEVITGVFIGTSVQTQSFNVISKVKFSEISELDARKYIDEYSPLDKAGSYGIQDWLGLAFIEKIEGSYTNIVGLPTHEVYKTLSLF
jgi:septum formation protein